ncbi:hypothetical protein HDU77_010992 [Chytriomyces hyalinus]|nr:hypothetical protein HDU77_010992 [Chytriomyces hyalinus]
MLKSWIILYLFSLAAAQLPESVSKEEYLGYKAKLDDAAHAVYGPGGPGEHAGPLEGTTKYECSYSERMASEEKN